MIDYRGLKLPAGETHLTAWMDKDSRFRDGLPVYQYNKYEAALLFARQRRVAVDIGAHAGLWTRVMALDFTVVHAFEPVEAHYDCLIANCQGQLSSGRVKLHPVALGDVAGHVVLGGYTPGSTGDTRIQTEAASADHHARVSLQRLDDLRLADVDFLKIDAEGYELFALRGAEETLRRCRPVVVVEQKPGKAAAFGLKDREAVAFLQSLGAKIGREISGDFIMWWGE